MVPSLFFLVSGIVLNVFSQSLLRVTVSSQVAGMAGGLRRGEVLGIMSSVLSAAMIAGPVLAGSLFDTAPFLPFAVCSLALALGFVIMKFHSVKTAQ